MISQASRFTGADETVHPHDPDDWSWNESWYFSFIDLDEGPAGFFRLGLLPNQQRAMLWSFVHTDGAWYGIEESRLALDDFDTAHTCRPPEHWLYWRTLIEAQIRGWDTPCRGWLEAGRYHVR